MLSCTKIDTSKTTIEEIAEAGIRYKEMHHRLPMLSELEVGSVEKLIVRGMDSDEVVSVNGDIGNFRLGDEVPQCPLNWTQTLKCGYHMETSSTKKYVRNWVEVHEKDLPRIIRNAPTEYFVKKLLSITFGAEEEPKMALIAIDKLVRVVAGLDESRFSKEYKDGMINLLVTTKEELQLTSGVVVGLTGRRSPKAVPFSDLSDVQKCPTIAAKVYFCKVAYGSLINQDRLSRQVTTYDNKNWEWFHLLFSVFRTCRHQDENRFRFAPDFFELYCLSKAWLLDPENEEIKVSVWKTLFDCFKRMRNNYVQIGPLEFNSRYDIADYLYTSIVETAHSDKNMSVRGLLAAANIVGCYRMPENNRHFELAHALLRKALELWPTYSKALVRMGSFYLSEARDRKMAKVKFETALAENSGDIMSFLHYYWLDSATPNPKPENIAAIKAAIYSKDSSHWPNHALLDAHFLLGCIMIVLENVRDGVREWEFCQKISRHYFLSKLFTLEGNMKKYGWKVKIDDEKEVIMNTGYVADLIKGFGASEEDDGETSSGSRFSSIMKAGALATRKRKPRVIDPITKEKEGNENEGKVEVQNGELEQKVKNSEQNGQQSHDAENTEQNGQQSHDGKNVQNEKKPGLKVSFEEDVKMISSNGDNGIEGDWRKPRGRGAGFSLA